MQREWLKRFFLIIVAFSITLFCLSNILSGIADSCGIPACPIEIQNKNSLETQLEYLRRFIGDKIVVLGDSVAFGKIMEAHGDSNWANHTISSNLEQLWKLSFPNKPVIAMNLAFDGALPCDLEQMIRILSDIDISLLVVDITMRSFSRDFEAPTQRMSRPWLAKEEFESLKTEPQEFKSVLKKAEEVLVATTKKIFKLYRYRDFLQACFLDGNSPQSWLREHFLSFFQQKLQDSGGMEDDDLLLILQARGRFSSVNFDAANPQRQAFERIVTQLERSNQLSVIFYAKENPEIIDDLIDPVDYSAWMDQFARVVIMDGQKHVHYLAPIDELTSDYYLDHNHVNADGYQIIAQNIWNLLQKSIQKKDGHLMSDNMSYVALGMQEF